MKSLLFIFTLVFVAALAVSPVYAIATTTFPHSDAAILFGPSPLDPLELDEPSESQATPGTFFDTTVTPLFKQDAGVIFFLEPGSVVPSGTYTIGTNSLSSLVSLASLSDVFGVSNQMQNKLYNVGYYSGNPNSTLLAFESYGVTGQTFTFMVEPDAAVDLTSRFLTASAISSGYTLTFRSDVEPVPDTGMTVSLLGISLVAIALLRLRLASEILVR